MLTEASSILSTAVLPGARRRHRLSPTGTHRSRGLLRGVPLVLLSTIAMILNLAHPADAATVQKNPFKATGNVPESVPTLKQGARVQAVRTATTEAAPTTYLVVEGDTVSGVAARFGLSTASVLAMNGLGLSTLIFPGQILTLTTEAAPIAAVPAAPPVASEIARYTIQSGDTISGIAAATGLTTAAILSANGLDRSSIIFPGQTIVLPSGAAPVTSSGAATAQPAPAPTPTTTPTPTTYSIASGDTISGVASVSGVPVQAILEANGLGWSSIIYPGQVLIVPSPAAAETAPQAPVAPATAANTITPLTDEMRQNATIIVSVGRASGVSDYGLVIALAAAAQESGLRNVHYGDRDSLGLFQQRPSAGWGSAEQVMDPVRAGLAFFGGAGNPNPGVTRGLLDTPGWELMTVAQAAQAVQISAYPDYYAKWEGSARAWLAELN